MLYDTPRRKTDGKNKNDNTENHVALAGRVILIRHVALTNALDDKKGRKSCKNYENTIPNTNIIFSLFKIFFIMTKRHL